MVQVNNGSTKAWIPEINLVRGFAILGVITIHVTSFFGFIEILSPLVFVTLMLDAFAHFGAPLFVLISGVVLAYNNWVDTNTLQFYKKRLQFILPLYVVLSIIGVIYHSYIMGSPIDLTKIIESLLFGTSWYWFWFIPMIISLYLLFPLFRKFYNFLDKRGHTKLFLLFGLVVQIGLALGLFFSSLNFIFAGLDLSYYIMTKSFLGYVFYFTLGIYVGRNIIGFKDFIKNVRKSLVTLTIIISGSAASIYFFVTIYSLPSNISTASSFLIWNLAIPELTVSAFFLFFHVSSLLSLRKTRVSVFIDELGTFAYGIYIFHPFFIEGFNLIFITVLGIYYTDAIFYPLLAVLTLLATYVFVKIIARLPYGSRILGVRSQNVKRPYSAALDHSHE